MKNIFIHTIIISVLALSLVSCEKEGSVGPNLEDLYGSFRIIDSLSNNPSVDFTTDEYVQFLGNWSLITDWKLEIVGRTSGSVKTITGKSKTLDTLIGQWNGTSDGLFFKQEKCDVMLTFADQSDTMRTTVTISKVHDYSNDGIVLADFEGSVNFNASGNTTINKKENTLIVPQGSYYYHMEGSEPGNSWWIGGLAAINAQTLQSQNFFKFTIADTATTYINLFYYGYGYTDSQLNFSFDCDINSDGTKDKSYEYNVPVEEIGWHKVSFKLSQLKSNNVLIQSEVEKLTTLYISLISKGTARTNIGCSIDYIIITQGKPL